MNNILTTTTTDNPIYPLGLALSGGGAKGFAHIGALKALDEAGSHPDIISGVSAGSLIGALYADGYTPDEISELFVGIEFSDFARLTLPKSGFFEISGFRSFLKRHLRAKRFEDLKIPLVVTATDLDHGKSTSFAKGNLIEVIVASCSIPVLFNPVKINGVNYVDGGVLRNFPVTPIRPLCKKIIGVNVSPLVAKEYNMNIKNIAQRSYSFIFKSNSFEDVKLCDTLVQTKDVLEYNLFDLENMKKIIGIGYDDTKEVLQQSKNTLSI